jgi:ligand-binding sensor domain-containing protein/two-component sensor histidine kinase
MRHARLLLLLILSVYAGCAQAQFRFISYSVSDGLSQNSVHCIYQDRDGFLWLGTQDGLNGFDGHDFRIYKHSETDSTTISDQFVLSITEDDAGYLWIGTRNGFNRLNKRTGKFTRYYISPEEKEGIGHSYFGLHKNKKGQIMLAASSRSAVLLSPNNRIQLLPKDIYSPVYDQAGTIWCTGQQNNIIHLSEDLKTSKDIYPGGRLGALSGQWRTAMDRKDVLWLYSGDTRGKLDFFDTRRKQWRPEALEFSEPVNHVFIAADGTGWVSTTNGIYLVRNYSINRHLTYQPGKTGSLPPGSILCTSEDRQGNIWIGSSSAGFAYYNPVFSHFQLVATGIDNDAVTATAESGRKKWIGTLSGLYRIERRGSDSTYQVVQHFFPHKKVTAIARNGRSGLWVAITKEGLFEVDSQGRVLQHLTRDDSLLQTHNILQLYTGNSGRLFVCTEKGYFVYDEKLKRWSSFYQSPTRGTPTGWYVLHAFEDREGRTWISKQLGVDVLDQQLQPLFSISSLHNKSPIHRTIITCCGQDSTGRVWIGTLSSGIYVYDKGALHQYTTADGLTSNVIYGLACDAQGRVWVSTTSGLNIFDPMQRRFFSLHAKDGLPVEDCMFGTLQSTADGEVLSGSAQGLMVIRARYFALQKVQVAARVSDVQVNGESVEALAPRVIVQPGYKTISFEFGLRQAMQPRNIIYQYRLKGVDKDWNTTGNGRITYTHLPCKTLVMQVRAAFSLTEIDDMPVDELVLEVRPAFWQTTTFLLVSIAAGLLALLAIIRWYVRAKQKKQRRELLVQQQLQQERERISRDLHDNIGAYTSALIAGINAMKNGAERRVEDIDELSDYAANIMTYLRETIWVLHHEKLSITAFADRFKAYAVRIMKNYPGINLSFSEELLKDRTLFPQVSLNMFRLLQEALQNACKHAGASCIEVGWKSNEEISIYVKDNGKGIEEKLLTEGYGLQNMRQRAREIGFGFSCRSDSGGTLVLFTENGADALE